MLTYCLLFKLDFLIIILRPFNNDLANLFLIFFKARWTILRKMALVKKWMFKKVSNDIKTIQ